MKQVYCLKSYINNTEENKIKKAQCKLCKAILEYQQMDKYWYFITKKCYIYHEK